MIYMRNITITTAKSATYLENVGLSLDDVVVRETVSPILFENVTIAQLYARAADLRQVTFKDCSIVSMIVDAGTVAPRSLPRPSILVTPSRTIRDVQEINDWYYDNYDFVDGEQLTVSDILQRFPIFTLLSRIARYKPFWIKDGEDRSVRKILDDPNWESLKEIMIKHDLLMIRKDVPASGPKSSFYHVKNKSSLLNISRPSETVRGFFIDLFDLAVRLERDGQDDIDI